MKPTDSTTRIDVPEEVRRDERLEPRIVGLEPDERVTLHVTTEDPEPWSSRATFEADEAGAVALAGSAPVAGDYAVADAMGPIWSLTPPDPEDPASRYPVDPLGRHELRFTVKRDDETVASESVTVRHAAPGVEAHATPDEGPHGTWFEPPGAGPHPPVLVLHGSGGSVKAPTAALLASEGYAAMALQYLGTDDLPERPTSVPLSYVEEAVDWFLERETVAGPAYGCYGVSMGAQLALVLASRDDRVAAVVSDSGNHVCYESGEGGAWSDDGADLPRIGVPDAPPDAWDRPVGGASTADADDGPAAVDRSGMWLGMLEAEDTPTRRAATLSVERSGAAFCLLSGGRDAVWPAETFHVMLLARLDALEYGPTVEHHWYQDAGHGIGAPFVPTSWRPAVGDGQASGGDPAAHAAAQADAWPRVRSFLASELGG